MERLVEPFMSYPPEKRAVIYWFQRRYPSVEVHRYSNGVIMLYAREVPGGRVAASVKLLDED